MAVSNCGLLGGVTVLVYSNLVPMVDQPHCTCEGWQIRIGFCLRLLAALFCGPVSLPVS